MTIVNWLLQLLMNYIVSLLQTYSYENHDKPDDDAAEVT